MSLDRVSQLADLGFGSPPGTPHGQLVVTPAAVKQHLVNLYDKFGIGGDDAARRVTLANEALKRGAVTLRDLHDSATPNA